MLTEEKNDGIYRRMNNENREIFKKIKRDV